MITTYYLMVMAVTLFFIWGMNYACKQGEIFSKPARWLEKRLPKWVIIPLFDCVYCMPSVWGTLSFALFLWGYPLHLWIVFVFCLTGLSALIRPN